MPGKIFISYSTADQDMADRVVRALEQRGIVCWIASRELEAGANYRGLIVEAIEQSTGVLLLLSKHANISPDVLKELAVARNLKRRVLPARLENFEPTGAMFYEITTEHRIDLFRDFDEQIDILCRDLSELQKNVKEVSFRIARNKRLRTIKRNLIASAGTVVAAGIAFLIWKAWPDLQPLIAARRAPPSIPVIEQPVAEASLPPKILAIAGPVATPAPIKQEAPTAPPPEVKVVAPEKAAALPSTPAPDRPPPVTLAETPAAVTSTPPDPAQTHRKIAEALIFVEPSGGGVMDRRVAATLADRLNTAGYHITQDSTAANLVIDIGVQRNTANYQVGGAYILWAATADLGIDAAWTNPKVPLPTKSIEANAQDKNRETAEEKALIAAIDKSVGNFKTIVTPP